jgi:prepilin-type processing-associated H-X9-DG protein
MIRCSRRVFSLVEILVVIGIIGLLIGILLPAVEKVRHRSYLTACESNLRSIGHAMSLYANDNQGHYPRTIYVPGAPICFGTGTAAANPFGTGGPAPNDITAALFLLARTQDLPLATFTCPYNDVYSYEPDKADVSTHSNFTNFRVNLGYSLADPYPDEAATKAGFEWTTKLPASFAIAGDKNPGIKGNDDDVTAAVANAPEWEMKKSRSNNHEKDGQNVLYADGHVSWELNPLCGANQDNIFTNRAGSIDASPVDGTDSLLLPTDDQ